MDGSSDNTRFSVTQHDDESTRRVEIDGQGKPRMVQRNVHASTTRVQPKKPEPVELPLDRWSVPLVTARLRRMAELFTRFPMTADIRPAPVRSNMPEPILERGRDYAPAAELPRIPLKHSEFDLASATFKAVLAMVSDNPIDRGIIWTIALKKPFSDCSKELREKHRPPIRISDEGLRLRWVDKIAPAIVELFNAIPLAILPADIERARQMLDRRMSTRKW